MPSMGKHSISPRNVKKVCFIALFQNGHKPLSLKTLDIEFFLTLGFRDYFHYHGINVVNPTSNTHCHAMISTHFEFSMYVLVAAFCQHVQIHRIRRSVLSVIVVFEVQN